MHGILRGDSLVISVSNTIKELDILSDAYVECFWNTAICITPKKIIH